VIDAEVAPEPEIVGVIISPSESTVTIQSLVLENVSPVADKFKEASPEESVVTIKRL